MKNLLIGLFLLLSFMASAQTSIFSEGFEGASISMTSQSTGSYSWATNTNYFSQGVKSDSSIYGISDTVYLVSDVFSSLGTQIVFLEFDQICKVELFDIAFVEVSNDNGATWTRLTTQEYQGAGSYYNNRFNEASYPGEWGGGAPAIPQNTWWKSEKFDISTLVANSAQVKIRFTLIDINANGAGARTGWLLDNINVWKPSSQEAALVSYELPYAMSSGCGLNNEQIKYTIFNSGALVINGNLTASFKREGQSVVTESINTIILPGDSLVYTFNTAIDLSSSVDTIYQVDMWVDLVNDNVSNNDSIIDFISSRVALASPVFSDTTISFASNVLLHATHPNDIEWFTDNLGVNSIETGQYYQTPNLYDTTMYYVQGKVDQSEDIVTTFNSNRSGFGNMFDIKAFNTLTIDSFYVNAATNAMIEVWYFPASYVGHNTSDSGWVKLGEYDIPNAVAGNQTLVPIGGLTIPAGQTYGICVTYITYGSINYTAGTGSNEQYQDGNMKISCGHAGDYFNYIYQQRVWNGRVFYHVGDIICPSVIEPLTVNISGIPMYDAGLDSIAPIGTIALNTTQPIIVKLINKGIDTLTKCSLQYSVNDSVFPAIAWTGSLLRNSTEVINLGNYTFSSPIYNIKAWVTLPNDSIDQSSHNDTITCFANSCLSGSVTLGGPTADFADFAALESVLNQIGVCGNTTVNILPGVYNQQLDLVSYIGVSASSQLIFQSATGNPDDVVIQYTSTSASDNYVVKFYAASYITLRNLTIKANDLTYAVAVFFTNGSNYNTLDSNIIFSNSSESESYVVYMYNSAPCSYNTVSNNKIIGGNYGIHALGLSADYANGNVFDNNEITDFKYAGTYLYFQNTATISRNKYRHLANVGNVTSIQVNYSKGSKVDGNDIFINSSGNQKGIYLYHCDSTLTVRGSVCNNMIITTGGASDKSHSGIYYSYGNGTDILYNSIYNSGGSSSSDIFKLYNNNSDDIGHRIYNNNIYNNGTGTNIYVRNKNRLQGADYNNIYGPNASTFAYWGGSRSDLSALQSASSSQNQNTISVNPQFVSVSDLHSISSELDGAGTPFTSIISTDFDGNLRDSITPDIGADEFMILSEDAGVVSLQGPIYSCSGDTSIVVVKINTIGVDTLFSYTINWEVDGVLQTPITYYDTLVYGQFIEKEIGTYTFASGINYQIKIWTSMPNGVVDLNASNDTLVTSYKTSLSAGTYFIGGNNPDYQNFTEAVNDLNQHGICGPVVFKVANGTYNENIKLENVVGVSSTNTIAFQSVSGDSSNVILTHSSNSILTNYVVKLDNIAYVTFKGITIQSTSATHSNVIILAHKPHNISIENCVIGNTIHHAGIIANIEKNLIHSIDSIGEYFNVESSRLVNGSIAISLNGGYARKANWFFNNNEFVNNSASSISLLMAKNCIIESNKFTNTLVNVHNYKAISIAASSDSIMITKNSLDINSNSSCQAISVVNSTGSLTQDIVIANNFVRLNNVNGNDWSAAFDVTGSNNLSILHNNVLLSGSYANTAALQVDNYTNTDSENLNIKNNIFVNNISSGSIYRFINCDTSSFSNDYNVLFSANGGFISDNIITLSDWQLATDESMHSMILNPYYYSTTDLHVLNNLLNGAAVPIAGITEDIDGEVRNVTNPDIGADEFTPSPIDLAVLEIQNPISACGLTSNENITIVVKNAGSSNIIGDIMFSYKLNTNATPVQELVASNILSGDSLVYTFAATADMDVNSIGTDSIFNISTWVSLNGDLFHYNDTVRAIVNSNFIPAIPVASDVNVVYGNSATLSTTSTFDIEWFANDTSVIPVGTSNTFQTPLLYDTTQYWLSANTVNCASLTSVAQVNITGYPAIDAGISNIVSPNTNVAYNISQEFKVTLKNYGMNTLTSAWIYWSIDNQIDSMLWAGSLDHSDDIIISLDTAAFTGGQYQFIAWTNMPNATSDIITSNDTSSFSFNVCMMGTYTIGDITTGNIYDFGNFTSAISELSAGGVCGPVTFMADAGIYEEYLVLPSISGASDTSRITFTSLGGDSTNVKVHYALNSGVTSTVEISGQYYTFNRITLSGADGNSYGQVIKLTDGAKYNQILNCVLEGENTTTSNSSYAVVYGINSNIKYNEFKNNLILNGSYSFYLFGSNANKHKGNVIADNTILNFNYGLYLGYHENITISGNFIESNNGTTLYGIHLRYSPSYTVTGNKINITASSNHNGMYFYNCTGVSTNRNLIANNFVTVNGIGSSGGDAVGFQSSSYANLYHNSIRLIGGGGTANALYMMSGTELNIVNNVIVNNGGGKAYYVNSISSLATSDYNNIYNTGGDLGYYSGTKNNLTEFQAGSGKDLNSVSVDPLFYSNSNLHSISGPMDNMGTHLSEVSKDIDGAVRSTINPDIGADEFSIPANDASLIALSSPTSPVAPGVNNLTVDLQNFGALTLSLVTIAWEVDGITQTPYTWSGSLVNGAIESDVNIGSYNFGAGATHLKIWVESPNNSIDTININDTLDITVISCAGALSGSYTIGGTNADYDNISAAVSSLYYCGISSSVVFNIAPGIYNEQVHIHEVTGASSSATITFQSSTLDSSDVNVVNNASNSSNYVWYMDGAEWITLKHIGLEAVNPVIGRALVFANGASNNTIEHNIIKGAQGNTIAAAAIYSDDDLDNFNTFKYNSIQGGYYGIYLEGGSSNNHEYGTIIEYNEVKDYLAYGIYLYYSDSAIISHNVVEASVMLSHSYAVRLRESNGASVISNNTITANTSSSSTGINIGNCEGTYSSPAHIFNNFISVSSSVGSTRGILVTGSKYQYITNNNIYVSASSTYASSLYISTGSSNRIFNNCLSFSGNGYALYIANSTSVSHSDYNNLYSNGNKLAYYDGVEVNSLDVWQNIIGDDTNSISVDPIYNAIDDLHVSNAALNGKANPLSWVNFDYDGEARDVNNPDIGADEFVPAPIDVAVIDFIEPNSFGHVGSVQNIKVVLQNMGSDTIYSVPLAYKYGSQPAFSQLISKVISPGDTAIVMFTAPINLILGQNELCAYSSVVGDGYQYNDTLCINISGLPLISPSYCDDFEAQDIWATTSDMWQLGTPNGVVIDSANSGVNAWTINYNTSYNNNASEYIYSPYYDFSNSIDADLSFWRNNILESNDGFNIEYSTNDGLTWILLGTWGDPLGTNWYNGQSSGNHYFTSNSNGWSKSTYDLSQFNQFASIVQFRFHFISDDSGTNEGVAFDDFCIDLGTQAYDAGVVSIDSPADTTQIGVTSNIVTVSIKNFGDSVLTSIPVKYQIDNNPEVLEIAIISGGLAPDSVVQFSFSQQFASPDLDYLLCVNTALSGDISVNNDQQCKTVFANIPNYDAAVTAIISPSDTIGLNQYTVTVRIKNFGLLPFSTCDIEYSTSTNSVVETWTGSPLAQGDSVEFTFVETFLPFIGQANVCAKTLLSNDGIPANDEICKSILTVGLKDQSLPVGMKLWQNIPNPTKGITTIYFEIPAEGLINFQLINGLGQPIYQIEENKSSGKHSVEIDASILAPGIYYYSLYYKGYRATKKLLVR